MPRMEVRPEVNFRFKRGHPHPSEAQTRSCDRSPSPLRRPRRVSKTMNWVQRKIYLYNVTFGLFMLDWWERYLFNTLMIVLMWFIFYNGSRYATEFWRRNILKDAAWQMETRN